MSKVYSDNNFKYDKQKVNNFSLSSLKMFKKSLINKNIITNIKDLNDINNDTSLNNLQEELIENIEIVKNQHISSKKAELVKNNENILSISYHLSFKKFQDLLNPIISLLNSRMEKINEKLKHTNDNDQQKLFYLFRDLTSDTNIIY